MAPQSWSEEDACGLCVELISGETVPDPCGMDLKPVLAATSLLEVEMSPVPIPKDLKTAPRPRLCGGTLLPQTLRC